MSLARLAELARCEQELVAGERWQELGALQAERQELVDAVPLPPADALPALEEALRQSRATEEALAAGLHRAGVLLGTLGRARRAASAYDPAGGARVETRA